MLSQNHRSSTCLTISTTYETIWLAGSVSHPAPVTVMEPATPETCEAVFHAPCHRSRFHCNLLIMLLSERNYSVTSGESLVSSGDCQAVTCKSWMMHVIAPREGQVLPKAMSIRSLISSSLRSLKKFELSTAAVMAWSVTVMIREILTSQRQDTDHLVLECGLVFAF